MLQSSCRDPTFAISKSTKLNFNGIFVVDHDCVRAETYVYQPGDGRDEDGGADDAVDDGSFGIEDSEELQEESISEEDIDLNSSDASLRLTGKKDGRST